jgi:hypothetical protein
VRRPHRSRAIRTAGRVATPQGGVPCFSPQLRSGSVTSGRLPVRQCRREGSRVRYGRALAVWGPITGQSVHTDRRVWWRAARQLSHARCRTACLSSAPHPFDVGVVRELCGTGDVDSADAAAQTLFCQSFRTHCTAELLANPPLSRSLPPFVSISFGLPSVRPALLSSPPLRLRLRLPRVRVRSSPLKSIGSSVRPPIASARAFGPIPIHRVRGSWSCLGFISHIAAASLTAQKGSNRDCRETPSGGGINRSCSCFHVFHRAEKTVRLQRPLFGRLHDL